MHLKNITKAYTLFTGQADASAQWAAYYAQMYAQGGAAGGGQPDADGAGGSGVSQPTSAAGDQDYTAQWAAYYRAYGMEKEAQQIEEMARNTKQVSFIHNILQLHRIVNFRVVVKKAALVTVMVVLL